MVRDHLRTVESQKQFKIFLTGGTGFLGRHIASRLLKQGHEVIFLTRRGRSRSVKERLFAALMFVDPIHLKHADKITIVEGDVTKPDLGLSGVNLPQIDEVWHVAGSDSFSEKNKEETFKTNIDGMKHILAFTAKIQPKKFHFTSTAFICGSIAGNFSEAELHCGQQFRNPYEESKFLAEHALREWSKSNQRIMTYIYRPSIVVGDSKTGKTCSYSGYYTYMRAFHVIRKRMEKSGFLQKDAQGNIVLPIEVPGNTDTALNAVSIDYAIDTMMKLNDTAGPGIYHITAQHPATFGFWLNVGTNFLGLSIVKVNQRKGANGNHNNDRLAAIGNMIVKGMGDYLPYITHQLVFDQANVKEALGDDYVEHCPIDVRFIETLLSYAVSNDFKEKQNLTTIYALGGA